LINSRSGSDALIVRVLYLWFWHRNFDVFWNQNSLSSTRRQPEKLVTRFGI